MGKSKGIPPMKRRHLSMKPSFGPIMGHISHEPGDWNHALLPVTSCNYPPENKHHHTHHTKLSKFKALEVLPKQEKTWISSVPRCRWELHLLLFMSHHFSRPQLQVFFKCSCRRSPSAGLCMCERMCRIDRRVRNHPWQRWWNALQSGGWNHLPCTFALFRISGRLFLLHLYQFLTL